MHICTQANSIHHLSLSLFFSPSPLKTRRGSELIHDVIPPPPSTGPSLLPHTSPLSCFRHTCPAPPSHTYLPILTCSCSTTVPLLATYHMFSLEPQQHSPAPSNLLCLLHQHCVKKASVELFLSVKPYGCLLIYTSTDLPPTHLHMYVIWTNSISTPSFPLHLLIH